MGRRKLEIKRIEDKSARQVTFSKRRKGLLKKAKELSILCDVEIGAVIFSNGGNLYQYSSSNSLPEILRRYQRSVETEPSSSTGVTENPQEGGSRFTGFHTTGELLKIVERELEEPFVDQLTINELQNLEDQLQGAIIHTRSIKTGLLQESLSKLQEQEKLLEAEKKSLEEEVSRNKRSVRGRMNAVIDLNIANDQIDLNAANNQTDLNAANNQTDLNAIANHQTDLNAIANHQFDLNLIADNQMPHGQQNAFVDDP